MYSNNDGTNRVSDSFFNVIKSNSFNKVENALAYLDLVKKTFAHDLVLYSEFLDIVEDFKSITVRAVELIQRISDIFHDVPELVYGLNAFLPQGYVILVHNNTFAIREPSGSVKYLKMKSRDIGSLPSTSRLAFEYHVLRASGPVTATFSNSVGLGQAGLFDSTGNLANVGYPSRSEFASLDAQSMPGPSGLCNNFKSTGTCNSTPTPAFPPFFPEEPKIIGHFHQSSISDLPKHYGMLDQAVFKQCSGSRDKPHLNHSVCNSAQTVPSVSKAESFSSVPMFVKERLKNAGTWTGYDKDGFDSLADPARIIENCNKPLNLAALDSSSSDDDNIQNGSCNGFLRKNQSSDHEFLKRSTNANSSSGNGERIENMFYDKDEKVLSCKAVLMSFQEQLEAGPSDKTTKSSESSYDDTSVVPGSVDLLQNSAESTDINDTPASETELSMFQTEVDMLGEKAENDSLNKSAEALVARALMDCKNDLLHSCENSFAHRETETSPPIDQAIMRKAILREFEKNFNHNEQAILEVMQGRSNYEVQQDTIQALTGNVESFLKTSAASKQDHRSEKKGKSSEERAVFNDDCDIDDEEVWNVPNNRDMLNMMNHAMKNEVPSLNFSYNKLEAGSSRTNVKPVEQADDLKMNRISKAATKKLIHPVSGDVDHRDMSTGTDNLADVSAMNPMEGTSTAVFFATATSTFVHENSVRAKHSISKLGSQKSNSSLETDNAILHNSIHSIKPSHERGENSVNAPVVDSENFSCLKALIDLKDYEKGKSDICDLDKREKVLEAAKDVSITGKSHNETHSFCCAADDGDSEDDADSLAAQFKEEAMDEFLEQKKHVTPIRRKARKNEHDLIVRAVQKIRMFGSIPAVCLTDEEKYQKQHLSGIRYGRKRFEKAFLSDEEKRTDAGHEADNESASESFSIEKIKSKFNNSLISDPRTSESHQQKRNDTNSKDETRAGSISENVGIPCSTSADATVLFKSHHSTHLFKSAHRTPSKLYSGDRKRKNNISSLDDSDTSEEEAEKRKLMKHPKKHLLSKKKIFSPVIKSNELEQEKRKRKIEEDQECPSAFLRFNGNNRKEQIDLVSRTSLRPTLENERNDSKIPKLDKPEQHRDKDRIPIEALITFLDVVKEKFEGKSHIVRNIRSDFIAFKESQLAIVDEEDLFLHCVWKAVKSDPDLLPEYISHVEAFLDNHRKSNKISERSEEHNRYCKPKLPPFPEPDSNDTQKNNCFGRRFLHGYNPHLEPNATFHDRSVDVMNSGTASESTENTSGDRTENNSTESNEKASSSGQSSESTNNNTTERTEKSSTGNVSQNSTEKPAENSNSRSDKNANVGSVENSGESNSSQSTGQNLGKDLSPPPQNVQSSSHNTQKQESTHSNSSESSSSINQQQKADSATSNFSGQDSTEERVQKLSDNKDGSTTEIIDNSITGKNNVTTLNAERDDSGEGSRSSAASTNTNSLNGNKPVESSKANSTESVHPESSNSIEKNSAAEQQSSSSNDDKETSKSSECIKQVPEQCSRTIPSESSENDDAKHTTKMSDSKQCSAEPAGKTARNGDSSEEKPNNLTNVPIERDGKHAADNSAKNNLVDNVASDAGKQSLNNEEKKAETVKDTESSGTSNENQLNSQMNKTQADITTQKSEEAPVENTESVSNNANEINDSKTLASEKSSSLDDEGNGASLSSNITSLNSVEKEKQTSEDSNMSHTKTNEETNDRSNLNEESSEHSSSRTERDKESIEKEQSSEKSCEETINNIGNNEKGVQNPKETTVAEKTNSNAVEDTNGSSNEKKEDHVAEKVPEITEGDMKGEQSSCENDGNIPDSNAVLPCQDASNDSVMNPSKDEVLSSAKGSEGIENTASDGVDNNKACDNPEPAMENPTIIPPEKDSEVNTNEFSTSGTKEESGTKVEQGPSSENTTEEQTKSSTEDTINSKNPHEDSSVENKTDSPDVTFNEVSKEIPEDIFSKVDNEKQDSTVTETDSEHMEEEPIEIAREDDCRIEPNEDVTSTDIDVIETDHQENVVESVKENADETPEEYRKEDPEKSSEEFSKEKRDPSGNSSSHEHNKGTQGSLGGAPGEDPEGNPDEDPDDDPSRDPDGDPDGDPDEDPDDDQDDDADDSADESLDENGETTAEEERLDDDLVQDLFRQGLVNDTRDVRGLIALIKGDEDYEDDDYDEDDGDDDMDSDIDDSDSSAEKIAIEVSYNTHLKKVVCSSVSHQVMNETLEWRTVSKVNGSKTQTEKEDFIKVQNTVITTTDIDEYSKSVDEQSVHSESITFTGTSEEITIKEEESDTPQPLSLKNYDPEILDYATLDDIAFYEKARSVVKPHEYDNFLRLCNMYNFSIILPSDFLDAVTKILGPYPNVFNMFKKAYFHEEDVTEIDVIAKPGSPVDSDCETDYTPIEVLGVSYRTRPAASAQLPCSGRTGLCKEVLNEEWISVPSSSSEDTVSVTAKKTTIEDYSCKIEDERFELDIILEVNKYAIESLQLIVSQVEAMDEQDREAFQLDDRLGASSGVLMRRAIKRIYGETAPTIALALKFSPHATARMVLERLMTKEKEWLEARRNMNDMFWLWREQNERHVLRACDQQSNLIKASDARWIKTKNLIRQIEIVYEERKMRSDDNFAEELGPHVVCYYPSEEDVITDATGLVLHYVKKQSNIQRTDKSRIKKFLKRHLNEWFSVAFEELSENEDDTDPLYSMKTYKHRGNKPAIPGDSKTRIVYGGNVLYSFLRLHHIICERLGNLKKKNRTLLNQYFMERETWGKLNKIYVEEGKNGPRSELLSANDINNGLLNLREQRRCPATFYFDTLREIRAFIDGQLENPQFEDGIRAKFPTDAYLVISIDKVIAAAARQLHQLVSDEVEGVAIPLYNRYRLKEPLHTYDRSDFRFGYEEEYQAAVVNELATTNRFKFTIISDFNHITTIEMLDTDTEIKRRKVLPRKTVDYWLEDEVVIEKEEEDELEKKLVEEELERLSQSNLQERRDEVNPDGENSSKKSSEMLDQGSSSNHDIEV